MDKIKINSDKIFCLGFFNTFAAKIKRMNKILLLLFVFLINCDLNAQNWKPQLSGTLSHLLSVSIVDKNVGYISGSTGTILKTIDGGNIWTSQNSGTDKDLFEISFINANRGFAVGTGNNVLATTNGGYTWNPLSIPATDISYYYRNIWFLDDNIGFITGGLSSNQGTILKTINGGDTWSKLAPNSGSAIYGLYFTSPNTGYYSNFNGEIKKTIDGGTTWNPLISGVTSTIYALYFTSEDIGYACGEGGIILKTTDAGASWDLLNTNTTDVFTDMAFIDEYVGFAVGGNVNNNTSTILKTTNSGASWETEVTTSSRQYGSEFLSFELGYSVGLDGTILKNTNITAADDKLTDNINNINVFPNPTNKFLTIDRGTSSTLTVQTIKIVNSLGMMVYTDMLDKQKSIIDMSAYGGSGIYYVQISDQNNNVTDVQKVIVL